VHKELSRRSKLFTAGCPTWMQPINCYMCVFFSPRLEFTSTKEQFSEALGAFRVLINRVQEYRSLKSDGFVHALAHLSICLVNLETGNVGECEKSFDYARTIIYREWPDFWIPTAPRWLRYISSKIHSMTGLDIDDKEPSDDRCFLTSIT
jgi:hypothetical protein